MRETLERILVEAVTLTPQELAVKAAIAKVAPPAGGKAAVLFARMKSRRVDPAEAEQMADEVRSALVAAGGARTRNVQQAFDDIYDELEDDLEASSGIGDMITQTLKQGQAARPNTLSMRSLLNR